MKVWVCQVRKEVFVGGESQRCRHTISPTESPSQTSGSAFSQLGCGVMELIGGEPIEWCQTHEAPREPIMADWCYGFGKDGNGTDPCKFESQIRVGPSQ